MKIFMIAPVPFFEPRGTPISILGRLRALSRLGHEVDLITYHVGRDVQLFGINIYRTPSLRFIKEVPVGPSWIKVLLDMLLITMAFRMLLGKQYHLIHTHEEASVFGAILAKLFRIPHLYDFHSSIPEVLKNFGYKRFPFIISVFEWVERWVIHSSDAMIVISPSLADYVRQIDDKVPLAVIENTFEILNLDSITQEEMYDFELRYPELDGKRVVLYTGTFEPYQGLDLLVSSAEHILRRRKDVMFVIVGGKSNQVKRYQERINALGLASSFLFTGMRPPQEMPIFLNLARALVSPRIEGNNTPLKIYAYLQSGKPIVATNHRVHTQILNHEIAVLVDPNPEAMALGILSVLEDSSLALRLGEQARSYFERHYNYKTLEQQTEYIIQEAMK
jgi:glycosyltransferase involved in cell wall biosynthesis